MTKLMTEPDLIQERFLSMASDAEKETLLLLPTAKAFHREEGIGMIDMLEDAALRGVRATILSPTDPEVVRRMERMNKACKAKRKPQVELVAIPEANAQGTVTLLVADQEASIVIEQRSPAANEFKRAIGVAIYSTSEPIVRANARFIERLKEVTTIAVREQRLRRRERRHRKQAQLLQDILTHDIRNFNQISLSSAEALRDVLGEEEKALVDNIIRATEGSSSLIDRARELSRIISGKKTPLVPVDLEDSIRRSVAIVTKARPDK